ncbi:MAG: sortase [Patescibacteria group bacterium]|nr:sortase [Patescibacteria group bacterium]
MALYIYQKEKITVKKKVIGYLSYLFLIAGSLILFWSVYPIVSFEIYSRLFLSRKIISPVYSEEKNIISEANSLLGSFNIFSNNLSDFTRASIWFPTLKKVDLKSNHLVKEYSLSIPKLNISEARVVIGEEDLSKSLVHYLPETLPGEYGNVVILGHSSLPQLYNPKDYKTIFTFLPSLEKGDVILVKIGDVTYEYVVLDMFVVDPDDVWVLRQQKDAAYLTLITCVPPGTYLKRLIVKAKLRLI